MLKVWAGSTWRAKTASLLTAVFWRLPVKWRKSREQLYLLSAGRRSQQFLNTPSQLWERNPETGK